MVMSSSDSYRDFTNRLKVLIGKRPDLITATLSNIFTMRLIGNKTHGDLAEIAIAEFVNQYMYDFRSIHVGKDLYRAKSKEEDVKIINEINEDEFPVSLKAYGNGPLQLSTDKNFRMFPRLEKEAPEVKGARAVRKVLRAPAFAEFGAVNVLPLIYDERNKRCNIMVFNYDMAVNAAFSIRKETGGKGRKHPVYRFYDRDGGYVFEVRYGGVEANALQRGLWTHTVNGSKYFDSITGGWIDYAQNQILVKLFSHALVSSDAGHKSALAAVRKDIARLKRRPGAKA